jgi:hypothetical protein
MWNLVRIAALTEAIEWPAISRRLPMPSHAEQRPAALKVARDVLDEVIRS